MIEYGIRVDVLDNECNVTRLTNCNGANFRIFSKKGSREKSSFLNGRTIKTGGGLKGRQLRNNIFFNTLFCQKKVSTTIKLKGEGVMALMARPLKKLRLTLAGISLFTDTL